MHPTVKIYSLSSDFHLPNYATSGSAGMDLASTVEVSIAPGERKLIPLGFSLELPEGYEAQIRPRSGLALKNGVTVLNSPGTIDSDYRGEVQVLLINHGEETFWVTKGMRIAQMVVAPVSRAQLVLVNGLGETERGEGGFGSTGLNFCSATNSSCAVTDANQSAPKPDCGC